MTVKDKLIQFNDEVEWASNWVGEGRFGHGSKREGLGHFKRFWGTPLPVWRSEEGEMKYCSIEELQSEVEKEPSRV